MHKNNPNYSLSREKYYMYLYVMKEKNWPIQNYAKIYMHYNFEMKKKSYYSFYN